MPPTSLRELASSTCIIRMQTFQRRMRSSWVFYGTCPMNPHYTRPDAGYMPFSILGNARMRPLREGLQLHPQDRELRTVELYHAYHGSDEQKKIALSLKLLQLDPENLIAHVILGSTCLKERDFDNAQHHLKTCMAIAPSEDTARMLEILEASRSGKGSWRLAVWAYRQKLLKRLFPKYYRRKRVKIRWDH